MKARFQMALPSFSSVLLSSSTIFINPFFVFSVKDISILLGRRRIETRTSLAGIQFAMSHDACLGIDLVKDAQHLVKCYHLLGGAVVLVLDIGAARVTTLVADANAARVVALHVATSFSYRTTIEQGTIATHINVISGIGTIAFVAMAAHQLLDGEVLVGTRVRAVEHQQVNLPR